MSSKRTLKQKIKNFAFQHYYTATAYKGIGYVRRHGIVATKDKFAQWLKQHKDTKMFLARRKDTYSFDDLATVTPLEHLEKSIAAHVHLYYVDLLDEFFGYLNNIPYKFDIYVSTKDEKDIANITDKLKTLKNVDKVDVRVTINRGRDIAPLYVQFAKDLAPYDYVLQVYSKKSLFVGDEQYRQRRHSIDCLLKSEKVDKQIFGAFESSTEKVGVVFPEPFTGIVLPYGWLNNGKMGKELLDSMHLPFKDEMFYYPTGSFFWIKGEAIKPLFDLNLKVEDFPEEAGQIDGTIAHALERAIGISE